MTYATEMIISVDVTDGPPGAKQKSPVSGVDITRTKRLEFDWTKQGDDGAWTYSYLSAELDSSAGENTNLKFVTIASDRYTFKDCGEDKAGVGFVFAEKRQVTEETKELVDQDDTSKGYKKTTSWKIHPKPNVSYEDFKNEQVFVDRPGQPLTEFKILMIRVNRELFDCTKSDDDRVVVTITYGLKR